MAHSFVKCWLHSIWSTKYRAELIHPDVEQLIYDEINRDFWRNGCFVQITNGMPDHVHSLFRLNPMISISKALENVKGGTSHWVNQNNMIVEKFAWQKGYAAYSVSESQLEKVYNYIKNQKNHHRNKTFEAELAELNLLHGLRD